MLDESLIHGTQSILSSSALKKSKIINATNAVTCRRKSKRTANAAEKVEQSKQNLASRFV